MKKKFALILGTVFGSMVLAACNNSGANKVPTKYVDQTPNNIYGVISDWSKPSELVKAGDTLTFKVTPSEDFFIDEVTNNGIPCTPVSRDGNSFTYSTVIQSGMNKIKATYQVDAAVDFVDKFKLNIPDDVFAEVMNPHVYEADKKLGLDFRRCGIEKVGAPLAWSNGKKVSSGNFVNYVDGDTTHVEANNLGYTIKIRYLGIDTPESTSEIEEWGLSASYYSKYVYSGDEQYKQYLDYVPEKAGITSLILVGQSASLNADKLTLADLKLGSTEQGTYFATADGNQRSLAYVWYSTEENPTKESFRCLNLEMVYQGFSFGVGSIEDTGEYMYKYFDKANLSAQANGRHLYSENEDKNYFDYEKKEVASLTMSRLYNSGTTTDSDLGYLPDSTFCNNKTLYKVRGYVSRKVGTSFYFQDQTSYDAAYLADHDPYGMYVFTYSETPIRVGDEVEVIGAISSYGGTYQMQGISYHTLNPNPNRDTKIISRGNVIQPIRVTGQEFNSKHYPQVLVEITDDLYCYPFTSNYKGEVSEIGEGGSQEVNAYNEAYPFYNTSNAPIFYAAYGNDNCATMNNSPKEYGGTAASGLRYSNQIIRFTVDQEILVTYGIDTCYSYKFFGGGTCLYNEKGAEYANKDASNPYKDLTIETVYKRKKLTNVVVMSTGYESTSGKRKMSAKICSGTDLTIQEIN